ncbi:MAG: hypothetical protein QGH93_03365 [Gammaproteobacteria bacterium]|nr:hypothetical protein [Chromatiales bacterium]MDP6673877.1 hypothetical protein [Gammaproteobacteria bacterium]
MKTRAMVFLLMLFGVVGSVQAETDFSGTWAMNTKLGENLGMMAALKETLTATQTAGQLTLDFIDIFQGKTTTRQVKLDLTGAVVDNFAAMGDPSKTASKWDGARLVTTWTTAGAIPGTEVVRTETHRLDDEGSSLTVTIERANRPTMILVYEKQ